MAYRVKKTDHAGAKKGRGFWARKAEAKHQSNRIRRRHDTVAVETERRDSDRALNPAMRVGEILSEPAWVHPARFVGREIQAEIITLLGALDISPGCLEMFRAELSFGQRQRIALVRALLMRPSVLLADEPMSALDAVSRAQAWALLSEFRASSGMAMVVVSHDIDELRTTCDEIAVVHMGQLVELGPPDVVFGAPAHPYTRQLLAALAGESVA